MIILIHSFMIVMLNIFWDFSKQTKNFGFYYTTKRKKCSLLFWFCCPRRNVLWQIIVNWYICHILYVTYFYSYGQIFDNFLSDCNKSISSLLKSLSPLNHFFVSFINVNIIFVFSNQYLKNCKSFRYWF